MNYLLRRRGLGGTSCPAIAAAMKNECHSGIYPSDAANKLVFRWGCTATVPGDTLVVNEAGAIHLAADKRSSRLKMQADGVFVPESWAAEDAEAISDVTLDNGVIVRPERHSQGHDLYYCTDEDGIEEALFQLGEGDSGYISKYIPKVREYRVYVVCGRVVAVADKHPDDRTAIAWNHSQGSSYRNVKWGDWPLSGCYEAVKATKVVGLDFAGIDVMEDAAGNVYVLEANSAPSLLSDYRTECMAKAFDWIVEHGKAEIPLGGTTNWRSFIHPAIWRE